MNRVSKQIINRVILHLLKKYPASSELLEKALRARYEIPVPLTHYYSPLPDVPTVKNNFKRWYQRGTLEGIDLSLNRQRGVLSRLKTYREECDELPSFAQVTAEGYGQGFGEVEAHFLHCIVRHFKPRKIIEVGSGVSTYFWLNAMQMNCRESNRDVKMVCVEPYPYPKLRELATERKVWLLEKAVQDVDVKCFQELEENDILFIDSTHVNKIDSDINWLYLEVLPNLKQGVVIHIHDIAFPYLTFPPEHPLFHHSLLWNEAALVKAFLLFNTAFEVLMCQSQLHFECPDAIKEVVSIYEEQKHFPASLWLAKKA